MKDVVTVKLTCDPDIEVKTGMLVSELVIIGVLLVDNCFVKVTDTLYNVLGSFG